MTGLQPKMEVFRPDGAVLREFVKCNDFVQIIQGPWGSGKTGTCCVGKIWKYACSQEKDKEGKRRTRWFIVRNTYTDLKNTTLKTWKDWFPEAIYGEITMSRPFAQHIQIGDVDCEIYFLALDDEEDRKKLLSLECTGIYFNEVREMDRAIVDDATGRVGRYPGQKYRPDHISKDNWPTWCGIIADTNAPSEDHWLPIMRRDVPFPEHFTDEDIEQHTKPDNWTFFMQPPAMLRKFDADGKHVGYVINPQAENLRYLRTGYYDNMIKGKKPSWIKVNVLNELGKLVEGKAVFETFREDTHVAKETLAPVPGLTVYVGLDFGRSPAAVFAQNVNGQWRVLGELQGHNMGASRFAPILKRELATKFPDYPLALFGDPAGDDQGQANDDTPFKVFRAHNLRVLKGGMNNLLNPRLEAVENVLGRMNDMNTGPAFIISPTCKMLCAAMSGGYQYKRQKVSGSASYSDLPDKKNAYSHIADALQYLLMGAGEGHVALSGVAERPKPVVASRNVGSPFTRQRERARLRGRR